MSAAPSDDSILCSDLSIGRTGVGGAERVIDGVSFTLRRGTTMALMGATGSGKSTLAAVLAGSAEDGVNIVGGDAIVEGVSVRKPGRSKRLLNVVAGYLDQSHAASLPARLSVSEIVAEPVTSRQRRVNMRAVQYRVATLLDELGLSLGAATKYPYELSAGMRQRVAIARTLMLDPKLVIADEPLANLDVDGRTLIRDALRRRQTEEGLSLLIVVNELATVEAFNGEVLVLQSGNTVGFGRTARDIVWTPSAGVDRRLASG